MMQIKQIPFLGKLKGAIKGILNESQGDWQD
jgi:hypothetical protein